MDTTPPFEVVTTRIPSLGVDFFRVESITNPERFRRDRVWMKILDCNGMPLMSFVWDKDHGMVAVPEGIPVKPYRDEIKWEQIGDTGIYHYQLPEDLNRR